MKLKDNFIEDKRKMLENIGKDIMLNLKNLNTQIYTIIQL